MKNSLLLLLFFLSCQLASGQEFRLASPQTPATRLLLKPSISIPFEFRLNGAAIRFTTDGSEPDEHSGFYQKPINVNGPATIKAKSFKDGFLPSETVTVTVLPSSTVAIDSIGLSTQPEKYRANGWRTLCDSYLGSNNLNENWLGFNKPEVQMQLFFNKKKKLNQVAIGLLRQQGSWIFMPQAIEVLDEKGKLLGRKIVEDAGTERPPSLEVLTINLPRKKYRQLTLRLIALPAIPDWHPGKGLTGWMFVDEVMVR